MTVQPGFRGTLDDALEQAETLRDTLGGLHVECDAAHVYGGTASIYALVDDACSRLSNLVAEYRDDPPQPGL